MARLRAVEAHAAVDHQMAMLHAVEEHVVVDRQMAMPHIAEDHVVVERGEVERQELAYAQHMLALGHEREEVALLSVPRLEPPPPKLQTR